MNSLHGLGVVFWAFAFGAIIGGIFGMIMILIRRRFRENRSMVTEIMTDLQTVRLRPPRTSRAAGRGSP